MSHSFFTRKLSDSQLQNANFSPALQNRAGATKGAKTWINSLIISHLSPPPSKYRAKPGRLESEFFQRNALRHWINRKERRGTQRDTMHRLSTITNTHNTSTHKHLNT